MRLKQLLLQSHGSRSGAVDEEDDDDAASPGAGGEGGRDMSKL